MAKYIDSDTSNKIFARALGVFDTRAHFIGTSIGKPYETRICSNCKKRVPVERYCCHCGARMEDNV